MKLPHERRPLFEDTGEIEHVEYLLEEYAKRAKLDLSEEQFEKLRADSVVVVLQEELREAAIASGIDEDDVDDLDLRRTGFNATQEALRNALRIVRGALYPHDWDTLTLARFSRYLYEIHALQGDLARYELAGVKKSRKRGGEAKTGKPTLLLKAMYRALYQKLGRPLTAAELVAEAKACGWMEERGGDLLLKGRDEQGHDVQSIIENDMQVIGNRLRSIKRFEGRINRT